MKRNFILALFLGVVTLWSMPLDGQNLIQGWDGNGVTGNSSKPNDVGWLNTVSASIPWNTANGSGGCRFRDAGVGFTAGAFTNEDGSVNDSRHMMLRYDAGAYSSSLYAYPVTLAANTTYEFSLNFLCGGSATPPQNLTIGASTTASPAGQILTKTVTSTSSANIYRKANLTFASTTAGTYYITFTGAYAWFGITNLNLVKSTVQLNELNTQYNNLTLANVDAVTSDLNLPTELGTKGVKVRWTSSNKNVIDSLGHVVRPEKYNAPVRLDAKLSQLIGDSTYTMTKTFNVIVLGIIQTPYEIAQWDFESNAIKVDNGIITVEDKLSGFVGTLKNEARIRTIGTPGSDQFNVLDLGNGTGYFDLGAEIGKAVYALTDYSVAGYFRIDDSYSGIDSNGNFYWTFSNSADIDADKNGYIIGSLKAMSNSVSSSYYNSGNQATSYGQNAPKGKWHHITYVQTGNKGTIYLDGEEKAVNEAMTNLPAFTLPRTGLTGTPFNWLGRSNYKNDAYLRNTLLYDFRLLSVPLSPADITVDILAVSNTLDMLNNAYASNPDYLATELVAEQEALGLGDLSGVTDNIPLPTKGKIDPTISIVWKSSNTHLIDATGVVTRPDFYNYTDTLTATLVKNGQSVNKKFYATVLAKAGSAFVGDLLVKYDFSQVSSADSIVTDVAEKGFKGKFHKDASIGSIGTSTVYNVLNLGDSIGYFDMGADVGKLMYNLEDYTVSAYYLIDNSYPDTELAKNGNFLWNFSNSNDIINKAATGYLIGSLRNQAVTITPTNWTPEQAVATGTVASKGSWHNMTYTQKGTTGTLYVDGMPLATKEVTLLPKNTLAKEGLLGTAYNWIGRSCYTGDVYLRNSLVHDFRLYRVALTESQIQSSELNVAQKIAALDHAYSESGGLNSIHSQALGERYLVSGGTGSIVVSGLKGTEKISVYDLSGRLVKSTTQSAIAAKAGIYIVKVDDFVSKVIVK